MFPLGLTLILITNLSSPLSLTLQQSYLNPGQKNTASNKNIRWIAHINVPIGWKDWKSSFKLLFMQRGQCPACPSHNGTLETIIWSIIWKIFCIENKIENKQFFNYKHWYLFHTWSDKAFQGKYRFE